jgi:hypothetical protein
VFNEAFPGDFSAGRGILLAILAVRVEIEGNVCAEEAGAFCGPVVVGSHGRWVRVVSMADDERFRVVIMAKIRGYFDNGLRHVP